MRLLVTFLSFLVLIFEILLVLFLVNYVLTSLSLILGLDLLLIAVQILLLSYEILAGIYICYLVYMIVSALIQAITIEKKYPDQLCRDHYPFVSIIIPSYNSRLKNIELSIEILLSNPYPEKEIIIADNSSDEYFIDQVRKLTERMNVSFYHKDGQEGFKAGVLNHVLPLIKGEYLILLDSDQLLKNDAIFNFIDVITSDENIAYVQGKFEIFNRDTLIRRCNAILYAWYYDMLSRAKDLRHQVLFNGTSACFRKSVLEEMDGFSEDTLTEDIDTSFLILSRGYESRLLNEVVTTALVSWRSQDLVSQFWRWTNGATAVAKKRTWTIIKSRKLGMINKVDLVLNGIVFFAVSGIVITSILICLMVIFGVPLLALRPDFFGIPGVVVIPACLFGTLMICIILSIFWTGRPEDSKVEIIKDLLSMIPFYFLSISLQFFILSALIDGLFRDIPKEWTRKMSMKKTLVYLACLITLFVITAYIALVNGDLLFFYMIFMLACALFPVYFFWQDRKIDVVKLEENYIAKMRLKYGKG
ncbi:MAG: glycosyltransferase [Candidatus Hodarchaeales archaeon]|jgi:cellulose synthase/poly-beta-1,6-N-acetylglucosamine synthase-like glycosyltransferase